MQTNNDADENLLLEGATSTVDENEVLPPLRFIDFEVFADRTCFPRYPKDQDLCVTLNDIDRDNSLIVFISHAWLLGEDGQNWPDNATNEKFKLVVEAIRIIKQSYAPGMSEAFIWLDYGCINQEDNPADELKQLDEIVRNCDLIFTPIFDENPDSWIYPKSWNNMYEEYRSPNWCDEVYGYVNRGWCRVEMFYAANIPTKNSPERIEKFAAGLKHHAMNGVRPHILYGSKDVAERSFPLPLSPLQNSLFSSLHPAAGSVSFESDTVVIQRLVDELRPYMKFVEAGYVGERNELGQMHGRGTITYDDGGKYSGGWRDDKKHGTGTFVYANGSRYEGEWLDGFKHGDGNVFYATGSRYEGEWKNNKRNGLGKLIAADGDIYDGEYKDDCMHGQGTFVWSDGDRYEGAWKSDKQHGYGKLFWLDGDRYEGMWENGGKQGHGQFYYSSGVVFDGEMADNKNVQGQLLIPSLLSSSFYAIFSGGDLYVNGYPMYDVILKTAEFGVVVTICKFSNGQLIEE